MNNPNSATTPEDQAVLDLIRQVAAEEAAKASGGGNNTPPQTDSTPAPLVLNIGGKEVSFKDANEASQVLNAQFQSMQTPHNTGRTVTDDAGNNAGGNTASSWTPADHKAFIDKFVENPKEAMEFLDEKRFGVKNPTEVIRNSLNATHGIAQSFAIDKFVSATPDYYVCPENAQAMESTMKELGFGAITPQTLEAAYIIAEKKGRLKHAENSGGQQNTPAYNPYLAAPPAESRRSATTASAPNWAQEAEDMTTEQLEKVLLRYQQ